jgi:hypothetical protein
MSSQVIGKSRVPSAKRAVISGWVSILILVTVIVLDFAVVRPAVRKMNDLVDASIEVYEEYLKGHAYVKGHLSEIQRVARKREAAEKRLRPGEVAAAIRVREGCRLALYASVVFATISSFHALRLFRARHDPHVRFRLALAVALVATVSSFLVVAAFEVPLFLRMGTFHFPFTF